jgi:hypothetical protein
MAKGQEFARPTTGAKMPESVNLFEDAQVGESLAAPAFRDIPPPSALARYGEAPYDHAYVQLTPDGEVSVVAKWQITRRIIKGRWEPWGYWAARDMGGKPITFEPLGWRELSE